jgi:hypothetical protein
VVRPDTPGRTCAKYSAIFSDKIYYLIKSC